MATFLLFPFWEHDAARGKQVLVGGEEGAAVGLRMLLVRIKPWKAQPRCRPGDKRLLRSTRKQDVGYRKQSNSRVLHLGTPVVESLLRTEHGYVQYV